MEKKYGDLLKLIQENPIDLGKHLILNRVSKKQNEIINIFYQSIYGNLIKDKKPISFGGKLNFEEFKIFKEMITSKFSRMEYNLPSQKEEAESVLNSYLMTLKSRIGMHSAMEVDVKNLPIPRISFNTLPFTFWNPKMEQFSLENLGFAISGEILALVPEPILIVKKARDTSDIKLLEQIANRRKKSAEDNNQKLQNVAKMMCAIPSEIYFVPLSNQLQQKVANFGSETNHIHFLENFTYYLFSTEVREFINSQLSAEISSPFSSIFLSVDNLMRLLKDFPFIPRLESNHKAYLSLSDKNESYSVVGGIFPLEKSSIVYLIDQRPITFQSVQSSIMTLCHLGATCYEFPQTKKILPKSEKLENEIKFQNFEYWTQSELDELAKERGIVNAPVWSEQDLEELAIKRGIFQIPEWTEEELQELASERNLPESSLGNWEGDPDLIPCPNCDYSIQRSWGECPICGYKLDSEPKPREEVEEVWKPPE